MKIGPGVRVGVGLAMGVALVVALFGVLGANSPMARAASGSLFASASGSGSTCSQADPCSLPTALTHAAAGDEVYVAEGTYTGAGAAVVTITQSIGLFGGWDGAPSGVVVRKPQSYRTTLDGEGARRVVYIHNCRPTVDGFTITGGDATGLGSSPGDDDAGGGVFSEGAVPTITHNVIRDNIAYSGSASYGNGGGVYLSAVSTTALISGNVIVGNWGNRGGEGQGGGLYMQNSAAIIKDNIFQGNVAGTTANSLGGGLHFYDNGASIVSGNLISGNQSDPSGTGFGGGFYSQFGDVTLSGNTIISNAAEWGAVTLQQNARVTVTNNVVARNTTGFFLRGSPSTPLGGTMANNTIVGNGDQGVYVGFYSSGYTRLVLTNNIIASHTTGIFVFSDAASSNAVTATHTLFFGNGVDSNGSQVTSANEITGQDPLFVSPMGWDYRLQPTSPAIDAGVDVPGLNADIDGEPRPNGPLPDIGADEAWWRGLFLPLVLLSLN